MKPTQEELKWIWRYSYSRTSLLEAHEWIDVLGQIDPKSPQIGALTCAIVIAYARPFTQSQISQTERVVPLSGVSPPSHLSATHETVLELRNKVMGHKDATPAKGDTATPNKILIKRDETGFDLSTIVFEGIALNKRGELKSLCSHFVAHCEARTRTLIEPYRSEIMQQPLGVYELLVTESHNDWIRPLK